MSKKIKLLYDITVLGDGYTSLKSRTGIFRVVEHLAIRLNHHPEIDLYYCCDNKLYSILSCHSYIKSNQEFSSERFILPSARRLFFNKIIAVDDLFPLSLGYHSSNIINKNLARLKYLLVFYLQKYLFRNTTFNKNELSEFDIYHNPFLSLPDNIYELGFKSVFVTIYDMIPILYPEYFNRLHRDSFNTFFNSINDKMWTFCISESTKTDLIKLKGASVNRENIHVIPLAASDFFYVSSDTTHNEVVLSKYALSGKKYVLSLCTLEPRKNIVAAIRAFARLVDEKKVNDLFLVLVGSKGWNFDEIFESISINGSIRKRVIVTGFVPDEDLAPIYSCAMMFVYPSIYEGFGLPPLEAMQCGVPVITSNTSSLPEVVGDAGIMIEPSDTDELCEAMFTLYTDAHLRSDLSLKGIERAKMFSWKHCGEKTVEAYKRSLD